MPLKLTKPEQLATLNSWAEDIERRLAQLDSRVQFTQIQQATHRGVFEHLFSNPHSLTAALAKAGVNVNANPVGTSTVVSTGGLPVFTSVTSAPAGNGTVVWTWPSSKVYWADGVQHTIPPSSLQGAITVTGLAVSTSYSFYPYWDYQIGKVVMVTSGCWANGTPPSAFLITSLSPLAVTNGQAAVGIQGANGHLALSNGGLQCTIPSLGGSGGGTGGGSGGGNDGNDTGRKQ